MKREIKWSSGEKNHYRVWNISNQKHYKTFIQLTFRKTNYKKKCCFAAARIRRWSEATNKTKKFLDLQLWDDFKSLWIHDTMWTTWSSSSESESEKKLEIFLYLSLIYIKFEKLRKQASYISLFYDFSILLS